MSKVVEVREYGSLFDCICDWVLKIALVACVCHLLNTKDDLKTLPLGEPGQILHMDSRGNLEWINPPCSTGECSK